MTVSISDAYRLEVVELFPTTWQDKLESFTVPEMEMLVEKLGTILQADCTIYHLMPCIYSFLAFCLNASKHFKVTTNK